MAFPLMGVLSIAACWKWGDWRNWKEYYPTILYLLIGNLVADLLLYKNGLWAFGPFVERYPFLNIATMLLIYPSTVILLLSRFPKERGKQAMRVLLWIGIYVATEYIANLTGGCVYHNGWNIWYSILFDCAMFPLLLLHYRKPLLVWPISAVLCFTLLWLFRVPLAR